MQSERWAGIKGIYGVRKASIGLVWGLWPPISSGQSKDDRIFFV